MKKLIALFLIIAMAAVTFAACNNNSNASEAPKDDSSAAASSESSVAETESSAPAEDALNLPDKKWDTELIWETYTPDATNTSDYRVFEIWNDEDYGDPVSKVTLERSRWLEETYGITIKMVYSDSLVGPVNDAKTAIDGGLELDVISTGAYSIAPQVVSGYFYDYKEINAKYNDGKGWLSLDRSYWDQTSQRDLSIGNKIFMLTGDICVTDDEDTWAMLFNKSMINEYGFESPYDLVDEGKWTLDALYEMAKKVTKASGEKLTYKPEDGNKWGMLCQAYDGLMFMLGCQQTMIAKDADDMPYIRIKEEANVNACQKALGILEDENVVGMADFYGAWNSGVYSQESQMFANGDCLFMPRHIGALSSDEMKDSDVKYGLLPMPKYDENQEEYSSSATVYHLLMASIPITNVEKLEATLVALEAMAWYGQKYMTPAYYETVLKIQRFEDTESEAMLDLIFRNRTYDMGTVYDWNNMIQFYSSLLGRRSTDIVSYYESVEAATQADIDNAIATFKG